MADILSLLFGDATLTGEERLRKQRAEAQAAALRGEPAGPPVQPGTRPDDARRMAQAHPSSVPTEAAMPPQPQAPVQAPSRPQALPKATGGIQAPPMAPQAPVAPPVDPEAAQMELYEARQQALLRQIEDTVKAPDMTGSMEQYGKRAEGGRHALALALQAGEAGAEMKPLQAHFLKQSAEAREPMKVHGGTLTETGFIEDPAYKQEMRLKQLTAQMSANQRIIDSNATRQEKQAAEKRLFAQQRELQAERLGVQRMIAGMADATRRDVAAMTAAGKKDSPANKAAERAAEGRDTLELLTEAEKLLPNATGSYIGYGVDQAARAFGKSTQGSEATAALNTIAGQLISKMPKMSGPQSDKDVLLYKQMAGNLADPTLPEGDRVAALKQLRALNMKYADGTQVPLGPSGVQPQQPSRPASAPVRVNTPAEAAKLPPGTPFITPDGQRRVRQ